MAEFEPGQSFWPEYTIDVRPLQFDSEDGRYDKSSSSPDKNAIWADYIVVNRYERDLHRYMMGIASPEGFGGDSVAFVQLANPTLLWICDWSASKYGEQPRIPDPEPRNRNWILLDHHWELNSLDIPGDGQTPYYRISGTYVYGNKNPSDKLQKDAVFPNPPWLEDVFERTVPESAIIQGISDTGGGGGGGTGATTPLPSAAAIFG